MNVSENAKNIISNCRFCWMCRHICPIGNATGLERNTARARAMCAFLVVNGDIKSEEIADNLYMVNSAIETLLNDANFERNAAKSYGKTNWFYKIFANEELVLWFTIVAFVVVLIVSMHIYNKLTFKSYYANVEVEFLSSVVKISDHVEKGPESKEVAKVIGQVLANDIKKNKTLKPEKKKKDKDKK